MFQVRTKSPMDDDWLDREAEIEEAAGTHSEFSGAGNCQRDHGWVVPTFSEAMVLRKKLETLPYLNVTIQEN